MSRPRVALFPGSFDPFTNGHLDLARRAGVLFDRVVIAVAHNPAKTSLFTPEERVEMIEGSIGGIAGASVIHFTGLLVDCAGRIGAQAIIRGLRAVSDFEFEFQMALMNRRLAPGVEIAFLMPSQEFTYLNSTLVKEVARHGGRVTGLVPPLVERRLKERFAAAEDGSLPAVKRAGGPQQGKTGGPQPANAKPKRAGGAQKVKSR